MKLLYWRSIYWYTLHTGCGLEKDLFLWCVVIIRPTSDTFVFVLQETVMGKTSHVFFFLSWYFLSEFALMDYIHHNCYFNIHRVLFYLLTCLSWLCISCLAGLFTYSLELGQFSLSFLVLVVLHLWHGMVAAWAVYPSRMSYAMT